MLMMSRFAVRHGNKFDRIASGRQFRGRPSELDLAIIGMRADTNHPHR
jgi:hypothetical protein